MRADPCMMTNEGAYSAAFYSRNRTVAGRSADAVVPAVIEIVQPRSVVDVGCGAGAWAAAFIHYGVSEVLGVDGDWVDRAALAVPVDRFLACDLTSPFADRIGRRFDLAVCLEVAEHLPPDHGERLVMSLTQLADTILFSAAVPGSGGTNHVNERWPTWWARVFAAAGFQMIDALRLRFWEDERVAPWYRQNMFLYTTRMDLVARNPAAMLPIDLVHPAMWDRLRRKHDRRARPLTIGEIAREIPRAIRRSVTRRGSALFRTKA